MNSDPHVALYLVLKNCQQSGVGIRLSERVTHPRHGRGRHHDWGGVANHNHINNIHGYILSIITNLITSICYLHYTCITYSYSPRDS